MILLGISLFEYNLLQNINNGQNADYSLLVLNSITALQGTSGSTMIQVIPDNGFSSPVTLSLGGTVPAGVTSSFTTNPITPTSGGSASTYLTLNVASSTIPGTYTIQVNSISGTISHSTTLALTVNPIVPTGDFIINATGIALVQGDLAPSTVNVTSVAGFNSPVVLSLVNPPPGITGTFATNPVTPISSSFVTSTLTIDTAPSVTNGTYVLSVNGTSGNTWHVAKFNATVAQTVPAGVANLSPTQPIVLSSDRYQLESAGPINIFDSSAGTSSVTAFVRSSSFPAGIVIPFSANSVTGQYTSNNQITFTSASTDEIQRLHASVGDTIYATYKPSKNISFLTSNTQAPPGGTVTGVLNQNVTFGIPGDIPITGDWDHDGITTAGIFRPSTATFFLTNSHTDGLGTVSERITFGQTGDIPVAGDWDGDGKTDVGVYRPSTAQFLLTTAHGLGVTGTVYENVTYGIPNSADVPVAGDWDGDGKYTPGIFRPSSNMFFLTNTQGNGVTGVTAERITWAINGDIPIAGDWDGDGKTDVGIFRPSNNYFFLSTTHGSNVIGTAYERIIFGTNGDLPIAGNWDGNTNHQAKIGVMRPTNTGITTTASIISNQIPIAGVAVSTSTNLACRADTDGDGICDEWESPILTGTNGVVIPVNGVNYQFTCDPNAVYGEATGTQFNNPLGDQVCPSPTIKDVYVEIDYMSGHKPDVTAMTDVVNAFLTHNIHLHLLVNDDMGLHFDSIPLTTTLDSNGNVVQTGYFGASGSQGYKQGYKDMFFGTAQERANPSASDLLTAKRQLYHYVMFIHDLAGTNGASGYGEIGGNDIIISLGEFTNHVGSTAEQEGTLMHELGHNLGLDHGGPVLVNGALALDHSLNCKPNYPSVMNYLYQVPILVSRPLDFSELTITNTLDENSLVDSNGIGASVPSGWQAVIGGVDANNNYQSPLTAPFTGGVAFDRSTITPLSSTPISKNIHLFNIGNCDLNTNNVLTTLNGYDDWDNMNLQFRGSGTFANGIVSINEHELTQVQLTMMENALIERLNATIESLPDNAFNPNLFAGDVKSTFSSELIQVENAIYTKNIFDTNGAIPILQNTVLPQMSTNTGNALLITNPVYQQMVSQVVYSIIQSLTVVDTPAPGTDHNGITTANETIYTGIDMPVGFEMHVGNPNNLLLTEKITDPSHGALTPSASNIHFDSSGLSNVTYTPNHGFVGNDNFTYQVTSTGPNNQTTKISNLGTVLIRVISAPDIGPVSSGNLPDNSTSINGTAYSQKGIQSIEISIDGGSFIHANGTTNWSFITILPDGSHTLTIRATDFIGLFSTKSVTISASSMYNQNP